MRSEYLVYVGNWYIPEIMNPGGISTFRFSVKEGTLSLLGQCAENVNVGAMALDAEHHVLYATDERSGQYNTPGGSLLSFTLDGQTGLPRKKSMVSSLGIYPSKIALDQSGKYLLLTNLSGPASVCRTYRKADGSYGIGVKYDESNLVLFRRTPEGELGEAADLVVFRELGTHPLQSHAMAHSVTLAPGKELFLVCDKGSDYIRFYRIDEERQKLACCGEAYTPVPGSGSRYAVFHPAQPYFYHNNELLAKLCVYRYSEDGGMQHLQTVSMLPEGMEVPSHLGLRERPAPADLVLSPDGRYLYASLRKLDQILVFKVEQETGRLTFIQVVSSGGENPRGLAVDPSGQYLLAANLDTKAIAVFAIQKDGTLWDTGNRAPAPNPGSIVFA